MGCNSDPYATAGKPAAPATKEAKSPTAAQAPPATAAKKSKPAFVPAAEGAAHEVVREAMRSAEADGATVVVYVGASWCEPCTDFHHAVERGELDEALAGVRFLEFDSDRDGARLREAQYSGRYIPRFVLPAPDGRGSAQKIEGGIKGEGSVAHIMARLGPLLRKSTS